MELSEIEAFARKNHIPVLLGDSAEFLATIVSKKQPKNILEIGTATNYIAGNIINETLSLPLTAFALAFSGLSVYLQTLSFAPSEIKKGKCLVMKMCQGLVAFTITLVLKLLL